MRLGLLLVLFGTIHFIPLIPTAEVVWDRRQGWNSGEGRNLGLLDVDQHVGTDCTGGTCAPIASSGTSKIGPKHLMTMRLRNYIIIKLKPTMSPAALLGICDWDLDEAEVVTKSGIGAGVDKDTVELENTLALW